MSTRLDIILDTTRASVAAEKACVSVAELERYAQMHQPRGWARALRQRSLSEPAIIAEIKKASPSKGVIRQDFDAAALAQSYEKGGAAALSVLTDVPYFQGSLRNLKLASSSVKLPCLRKDFMIDEYQVVEARAHCADAVLLIAAALSSEQMRSFAHLAHQHGLDVLVEVHTARELEQVLDAIGEGGADAIGVNNRDLKTFEVRMDMSFELASRIPSSVVRVAESGLSTPEHIERLRSAGFDAFLIGESLMRQLDPGLALAALLAGCNVGR